jgi:phage terminase large subunit-like protein
LGRARLSVDEKARRGTLEAERERRRGVLPAASEPAPTALPAPRDYPSLLQGYVADVLAGRIVASKWVRLACERHRRDLRRSRWAYSWSDAHVTEACHFLECLPHVEGKWDTPTIVLQPWQVFIVGSLFGWRHRADVSRRRFSVVYLETGRKSAKSTLCAGLGLYHLLREGEPGAQVICGATTGQQARIVFSIMQRQVRASTWLRDEGVQVFANAIVTADGDARPVNSKASTLDGLNPSLIILDESHAQTFGLHDVLKSAQGSRRNPLLLCPTTAGYDLLSVGYALRSTLCKVLDRVFEADHVLGGIWAIDEGDAWTSEAAWPKANPSLGISPTREWVRRYCADAQQTPGLEGEFRTKVCSEWLHSASAWLPMAAWTRCADPTLRIEQFQDVPCCIGVDAAERDDLTAVVAAFLRDDILYCFPKFFLPRGVVEERSRLVPAYRVWLTEGVLEATEGDLTDMTAVETYIRLLASTYQVRRIAIEQFGGQYLASMLQRDGYPVIVQGKSAKYYTGPARELEARVKYGRFGHAGNSCLTWMASNAVVDRRTDGSLLPKKETASSPNKVDGIDGLLLALGELLEAPEPVAEARLTLIG